MNTRTPIVRLLLTLAAAVLGLLAGPAFGATYTLRAAPTTLPMPDGAIVQMWGFALVSSDIGAGEVAGDDLVTVPGPRLVVPAGQSLTVNIVNELPVPTSIVIPGQSPPLAAGAIAPVVARHPDGRVRSFVHEAPAAVAGVAGPAVSYTWPDVKPGTYLYHSGTHPAVQVQMGLYGAATKNAVETAAGAPAESYPGAAFDAEVLLIAGEIDPALHAAVFDGSYGTAAYPSTLQYHPRYFLVNGVATDAVEPAVTVPAGSRLLLRFVNAGLTDHVPQLLGSHISVLAEDGKTYPFPREQASLLLAAGKSIDALLVPARPGDYPVFDRRLYRSRAATVQGPMQTLVRAVAP